MPRSPRSKILALILAGGVGGRLEVLTAERAKPAVPFAGADRRRRVGRDGAVHVCVNLPGCARSTSTGPREVTALLRSF